MTLQEMPAGAPQFDICRAARIARDARYDGLFFSGAITTKIYCRPICPGKPPLASNQAFFLSSAQAEAQGYRPCLRCRPEIAPGNHIRSAANWKVRNLLDRIHQGERSQDILAGHPATQADALADFQRALGSTLSEYEKTFQLGFAKMLISDTALPLSEIAILSDLGTSRSMMKKLSGRFRRDPKAFRKPLPVQQRSGVQSCALRLSFRPPLDWDGLLRYLQARAIAGVEQVEEGAYHRSFSMKGTQGWFSLRPETDCHAIRLEVHAGNLSCLRQVVWRVRRLLDLDADPMALEAHFHQDQILGAAWQRHPGLRVPVAWDGFEFAVRAVVGQVVSVGAATTFMGRIANRFSQDLSLPAPEGVYKLFPDPKPLLKADLLACGLSRTKAAAITAIAREVAAGRLELHRAAHLDTFIGQCVALRGIGDWTAQTIAMRGLGDPDAFPAGDLGIVKALSNLGEKLTPNRIGRIALGWRPWRAYAAMLLWQMKGL